MNKIVASLGLAAISASSLQSVYAADDLGAPTSKIWNVSASLRGFYDDNINNTPSNEQSTYGFEILPGVGLKWDGEGTSVAAKYTYIFRMYDHVPTGNTQKYDQNHIFDFNLQHSISPRYHVAVNDSFVIGQEPDTLRAPAAPLTDFQRVPGSNIRNYGNVGFNAKISPVFSTELAYRNTFFDYDDEGGNAFSPSFSALLDRIENGISVEGHWLLRPTTTGLLGYKFGDVLYTGDEPIGITLVSEDRNSRSHYGYLGVLHTFRPDLQGSLRAGVQYIDFYNDPGSETDFSPYILLTLRYLYGPDSHWEIGFSQTRSSTDIIDQVSPTDFVHDTDVSLVYGTINQRIAPHLYGNLIGTFQNSVYNGGSVDGDSQQYFQVGVNLQYRFNSYLSAEVGYNYDNASSDIPGQNFDRNRVYIGIGANY